MSSAAQASLQEPGWPRGDLLLQDDRAPVPKHNSIASTMSLVLMTMPSIASWTTLLQ